MIKFSASARKQMMDDLIGIMERREQAERLRAASVAANRPPSRRRREPAAPAARTPKTRR